MTKPPKKERKFLRQCAACRAYKDKSELIRLTKDYKTGETSINQDNSIQGRSIYVCGNSECIEKLCKNKKILSALKTQNGENIKEMLNTVLKNIIVLQL